MSPRTPPAARFAGLLLLGALVAPAAASTPPRLPAGGATMPVDDAADHVTPALDRRIVEAVDRNVAMLRARGHRFDDVPAKVSGLTWPMGPYPGRGEDWSGISGFVDLDPAYPNQVRDYTCAARSYDTAAGYNHRGIDYFIWPFPWLLMDSGAIDVRAAAPGTLIEKRDGADDRSCSFNAPDDANYVIVRHADGTIARYLHMRGGSVTTLPIGATIAAGQVLGKVGSSGISTGPHLHFELRATNAVNAPVIEPHTGQCNAVATGWAAQRPYRDPRINRLSTHGAPPVPPTCSGTRMPGTDTPNFKDTFQPGETLYTLAAYRDIGRGETTRFRVLRPDLTALSDWTFDMAQTGTTPSHYNGAYWYWTHALPANAPHGLWLFEAEYAGKTSRHPFRVGNTTTAIADLRGLIGAWFEPATSGQGLEFHWINDRTALVFFYGHHDDGSNFFLLGQRDAPFDFGQEVVFEMRATSGGRWNGLDPTAIQRPVWGELRITFVDCDTAVAELDGADGVQVLELERLGRTTGLDCGG